MKRHVKTIVVSVLVITLVAVAVVLLWASQDRAPSSDGPVANEAIITATPEGTQKPDAAGSSESDPSPNTNLEINIYAVEPDTTLYRLVNAYAQKH